MRTRTELLNGVWWHVYPLGACGAPIRDFDPADPNVPGPRLRRLLPWLDYAVELGCTGLLLNPIFSSSSHGYDTLDYFRIDPRLGGDEEFDELMRECEARGLAVMLDGVFNHVDRNHPLVEQGFAAGGWEGHESIPVLDHSRPEIRDLVTEVMLHWLRRGIAGWRLDVAHEVPHEFWREVIGRARGEFPEALFLGEMIHGDYQELARESDIDTVTQYELWAGIRGAISDANPWELSHALTRHAGFSRELVTQTFVGNHDVVRTATALGEDGAALAAILLLTVPGSPSIYYGDEQGFRGDKKDFGPPDDDLRAVLPESPIELFQLGWWMYHLHQRLIQLRRENPWISTGALEVTEPEGAVLAYEVSAVVDGSPHTLAVEMNLEAQTASVTLDGTSAFSFRAGQR
nr:alpha-amylase [Actinomycetales bacterium]